MSRDFGSFSRASSVPVSLATLFAFAAPLLTALPDAAAEQRESWKVSCYAYRDVNRNGVFDMGDRPFGSLPIRLTRPDGTQVTVPSNIDGFANFDVRLGDRENAYVFEPGAYEVRSFPAPGWVLTADNDGQVLIMERIEDAPGAMFVAETCDPIGVTRLLAISERVSPPDGFALDGIRISISNEEGKSYEIPLDTSGHFEFVGHPGSWTLTIGGGQSNTLATRHVELSDAAIVLSHIDLKSDERDPWAWK